MIPTFDPGYSAVTTRRLTSASRALVKTSTNRAAASRFNDYPSTGVLNFGPPNETNLRTPASIAFGNAVLVATGTHDPAATGHTDAEMVALTVNLISSFALSHAANGGTWGGEAIAAGVVVVEDSTSYTWQGAYWVALAAVAARLLWTSLSGTQKAQVDAMVVSEANRFLQYTVPYMRSASGRVNPSFVGSTKAEENAWNSWVLFYAAATQPSHANATAWISKAIELVLSATATPAFPTSKRIYHETFSGWALGAGSNIELSGTLENHGIINPNYVASLAQCAISGLTFAWLRGSKLPAATLANAELVYQSLIDVTFASPPQASPGGKVYTSGSAAIYYPGGAEGDATRMASYMAADAVAHTVRADSTSSVAADVWLGLHAQNQIDQQAAGGGARLSYWDLQHGAWCLYADWVVGQVAPVTDNRNVAALLA